MAVLAIKQSGISKQFVVMIDNHTVFRRLVKLHQERWKPGKQCNGMWKRVKESISGTNIIFHWIPSHGRHLDWSPRSDLVPDDMTMEQTNDEWRRLNGLADKGATDALKVQKPQVVLHEKIMKKSTNRTFDRIMFLAKIGEKLWARANDQLARGLNGADTSGAPGALIEPGAIRDIKLNSDDENDPGNESEDQDDDVGRGRAAAQPAGSATTQERTQQQEAGVDDPALEIDIHTHKQTHVHTYDAEVATATTTVTKTTRTIQIKRDSTGQQAPNRAQPYLLYPNKRGRTISHTRGNDAEAFEPDTNMEAATGTNVSSPSRHQITRASGDRGNARTRSRSPARSEPPRRRSRVKTTPKALAIRKSPMAQPPLPQG